MQADITSLLEMGRGGTRSSQQCEKLDDEAGDACVDDLRSFRDWRGNDLGAFFLSAADGILNLSFYTGDIVNVIGIFFWIVTLILITLASYLIRGFSLDSNDRVVCQPRFTRICSHPFKSTPVEE